MTSGPILYAHERAISTTAPGLAVDPVEPGDVDAEADRDPGRTRDRESKRTPTPCDGVGGCSLEVYAQLFTRAYRCLVPQKSSLAPKLPVRKNLRRQLHRLVQSQRKLPRSIDSQR